MLGSKLLSVIVVLFAVFLLPIRGMAVEESMAAFERGPLCCGAFSLTIRGGIAPAIFSHRETSDLVVNGNIGPIVSQGYLPEFFRQFQLPWMIGAEFAWNASARVQFFAEYSYTQARGESQFLPIAGVSFAERLSDLRMNASYLGARYYFNGLSSCFGRGPITPYVGFKAGVVWQAEMRTNYFFNGVEVANNVPYYLSLACVSGGLQLGAEWRFCSCWSLLLQGEFIATQGPVGNSNIVLDTSFQDTVTNLFVGNTGWLVTFPVTLGLRWTF